MTNQQNYTLIEIQTAVFNNSGRLYGVERIRQLVRKFHAKSLNPKFHTIEIDADTAEKIIYTLTHSALARQGTEATK